MGIRTTGQDAAGTAPAALDELWVEVVEDLDIADDADDVRGGYDTLSAACTSF